MPEAAAWPWLIASVIIHLGYFAALIEAYRAGDLGQVYPIARGSAPLMTAAASLVFVGERLSLVELDRHRRAGRRRSAAVGARRPRARAYRPPRRRLCASDRAHHLRLFGGGRHRRARLAQPAVLRALAADRQSRCCSRPMRCGATAATSSRRCGASGCAGFAGGALQTLSYGIALWAMTLAPIAIVATSARDQRTVRRGDRRRRAQGAAARGAHRRGVADCGRIGPDPVAIIKALVPEIAARSARGRLRCRRPKADRVRSISARARQCARASPAITVALPQAMPENNSGCVARAPIST